MNSISYLDSILSRSLTTSRRGSGTSTPNRRAANSSLSAQEAGGRDEHHHAQAGADGRIKLNRRASDNLLTDRAAARRTRAALAFTPFRASVAADDRPSSAAAAAGKRRQRGSDRESSSSSSFDASLWPEGEEDSSPDDTGSSASFATASAAQDGGEDQHQRAFLRSSSKGNGQRRTHPRSRSDHDGLSQREGLPMRRTGSSPGSSSSMYGGGGRLSESSSRNSWANLWGLTDWGDRPTDDYPQSAAAAGLPPSSARRRRRHASRTASLTSSKRASIHSDVNVMSEIERENIVEFEGGEEEEPVQNGSFHAFEEALPQQAATEVPESPPPQEAEVLREDKSKSGDTDSEKEVVTKVRGEEERERRTSLPSALPTDLTTSEAKAQMEKASLASTLTATSSNTDLSDAYPTQHAGPPPSYEAATIEARSTHARTKRRENLFLRSLRKALRGLHRALVFLLTLPLRALGWRVVPANRPQEEAPILVSQQEDSLPPRSSPRAQQGNHELGKGDMMEQKVEHDNEILARQQVLPPQRSSRLLPNPHPVDNLLGHDPRAKRPTRAIEVIHGAVPLPSKKRMLGPSTTSIIHHSPKTLVLDLDETLIHSTSRSPNWSALRGGPVVSTGGGLLGMEGFGDLLGLRGSTNSRLRPHMVEVILDGRSVLYHVYKRPWVDHFLRKVSLRGE